MKFNRIISSALVLVMLLTSIMSVMPIGALAADAAGVTVTMGEIDEAKTTRDALRALIDKYKNVNYSTAAEMLEAEIEAGYLDVISAGGYNLYVNRYTGFAYYENTKTGQILTSNPVDPKYGSSKLSDDVLNQVLSQVEIEYADLSNPSVEGTGTYYSIDQIYQGSPLNLTKIEEADGRKGISVQYTLGVNAADFRVPAYLLVDDFIDHIAKPVFDRLEALILDAIGEGSIDYNLNNREDLLFGKQYHTRKVINALDELDNYVKRQLGASTATAVAIAKCIDSARIIFNNYNYVDSSIIDPSKDGVLLEIVPALKDGKAVYKMRDENLTTYRLINMSIAELLPETYTKVEAKEDLDKTGYVPTAVNSASFSLSINYTLNEAGELYYEIPMTAPYFVNNNLNYTVKSISALRFFGAGDTTKDGYIFFPDGSGTIVDFADISDIRPNYKVNAFGKDYGYGTLTVAQAHLEQSTMPVYGLVNEVKANAATAEKTGDETITNGFFAVLESGSTLTSLGFASGGSTHKYAMASASYTPHPMDICDLSETISVSGLGFYYVVSKSTYEGTYKTKIEMLVDEKLRSPDEKTYAPSYVGMAEYYRDYLIAHDMMPDASKVNLTEKNMPLYAELLGAMDVTQKILSFPVVVSTPLTSFGDVKTIYSELSAAGVKNVNFRLTGFANGGMAYTYPAKVWWENSLGGDSAVKDLVNTANDTNKKVSEGYNFGLYPDFDFLYIHNTALFDGVSNMSDAAVMVDNRYASKQSFNAILQVYESLFSMVVSPDRYDELYGKFNNDYKKFGFGGLSVATLGSELNSNFDQHNAIHRESSLDYVKSLLGKMAGEYSLMIDVGNVYALKFADHILNAPTDSSHYKYSSYTVPFYGMVLHGYVNYAGKPINYSGFADYDILRSIESGAALQYILCYENTNYLKDDKNLSKYYGVDYKNWKESIIAQYNVLNGAIGDLQDNIISNHASLVAERVIQRDEIIKNYALLTAELLSHVDEQFEARIAEVSFELRAENKFGEYSGLYAKIDTPELVARLLATIDVKAEDAKEDKLTVAEAAKLGVTAQSEITLYDAIVAIANELVGKFEDSYSAADGAYEIALSANDVSYTSKYNFNTASYADDADYAETDYTCSNNNVVMVVYTDPTTGAETIFFINYNVYSVKIRVDLALHEKLVDFVDEKGYITLGDSDFIKIQ